MTIEQLLQIELIKQLKYRYVRAMDTHDWALMARCFTEDAIFVPHDGKYRKQGRDEIVGFFEEVVTPGMVSSHSVMHPEIEMTGGAAARGRWRLVDTVYFTQPNTGVRGMKVTGDQVLRGAGYYYDEYALVADGWRISYLTSARIFTQLEPFALDAELTIEPTLGAIADRQRERGWGT